MSVTAIPSLGKSFARTALPRFGSNATWFRGALVLGCIAVVTISAWVGRPAPYLEGDFELARLLRGMAAIKACIVLAAICLLFWRFGRPVSPRIAGAYLVGAWLVAGASMLIWQLTFIPLAAVIFHVGGIALLATAWRDRDARVSEGAA